MNVTEIISKIIPRVLAMVLYPFLIFLWSFGTKHLCFVHADLTPTVRAINLEKCTLFVEWTSNYLSCRAKHSVVEISTRPGKVSKITAYNNVKIELKRIAVFDLHLATYYGKPCNMMSPYTNLLNKKAIHVLVADKMAEINENVKINCELSGSYEQYKLYWTHHIADQMIRTLPASSSNSLLLPRVTVDDAGRYTCVVNFTNCNDYGLAEKSASLEIRGPPLFVSSDRNFSWTENADEYANFSIWSNPELTKITISPVNVDRHFPTYKETYGYTTAMIETTVHDKKVFISGYVAFYRTFLAMKDLNGMYKLEIENSLGKANISFQISIMEKGITVRNYSMDIIQWLGVIACPVAVVLLVILGITCWYLKKRNAVRGSGTVEVTFDQMNHCIERTNMSLDTNDTRFGELQQGTHFHDYTNNVFAEFSPQQHAFSKQNCCYDLDTGYLMPQGKSQQSGMFHTFHSDTRLNDEPHYQEIDELELKQENPYTEIEGSDVTDLY